MRTVETSLHGRWKFSHIWNIITICSKHQWPNIAAKCQWTEGSYCNYTLIISVFFTLFLFVFLFAVLKKIQLGNLGCILKLGPGNEKVTNCREMIHKMSNLCTGNQEYTVLIFSSMPDQWILYIVDIIRPIYIYNLLLKNTKHSFLHTTT